MDPLKLSDLHVVEDWEAFNPDMKGYIPPQKLELWHQDCDGIEEQIRQWICTDYMRDNGAPFLALSVAKGFGTTSLTIRDETFAAPLSSREIKFLTNYLGSAHASRYTVSEDEVILSDACRLSISKSQSDVLGGLKASDGDYSREATFAALDVFKAGSHELSASPQSNSHIATIFVILPSFTNGANIRLHATHETVTSEVKLPTDISESFCSIGMYTGVSGARIEVGTGGELICITYHVYGVNAYEPGDRALPSVVPRLENLSGALPPLRDAFCLWRHSINSGADAPRLMLFFLDWAPKSASNLRDTDATLLCNLAPLAKAYGFKMYIADLVHTMSTTQEVSHPYKEYFETCDDIDPSDLYMSDHPKIRYEWKELRTLGGATVTQKALLTLATKTLTQDDVLQDKLTDLDIEDEDEDAIEIVDDSLYEAKVVYKHIRKASILFIAA
ncbi:hypothetical protein C8R44DRAFT_769900 [Mycena epipterygia]|nr:hypothetical protein C8R44DRAFT_769900 [Mycena epipterygia]